MERKLARAALISPAPSGWKVSAPGGGATTAVASTLGEAAQAVPVGDPLHLALPSDLVILERMTLPSTDPAELGDMMRLQLEKSLPFPPEEVTSDFSVLKCGETDSTVLAMALPNAQLETLCQPLRAAERLPEQVTMYALHVAASCPAEGVFLAIHREEEKYVAAIVENARLVFLDTLPTTDAAAVPAELTQLLFTAELDGVPTNFAACRLDEKAKELQAPIAAHFSVPVELFSLDETLPEPGVNLLPDAWKLERRRVEKKEALKAKLIVAAAIYLAGVAAAFGYLIYLRSQVAKLDGQIRQGQPQVRFIEQQIARWEALAPAIDPARYPVEILNQLVESRPGEDLRFTNFAQREGEFNVEIEAASLQVADDFGVALQNNPVLSAYKIQTGNPDTVSNGRAKLSISGKR